MGFLSKLKTRKEPLRESEPAAGTQTGIRREKTIPPHVVACKVCEGTGEKEGQRCPQCAGSGRVIVSCEVTTYVTAYVPEKKGKEEKDV